MNSKNEQYYDKTMADLMRRYCMLLIMINVRLKKIHEECSVPDDIEAQLYQTHKVPGKPTTDDTKSLLSTELEDENEIV